MTPQDVANAKRDRMSKKRFAFPYGETWINNKANSEQTSTPYKFTAKEYDEETGLYYYGARYYDAKLSRWVSADDRFDGLYSSQGQDVFAYVHGRPVMMIDPDGHDGHSTRSGLWALGDWAHHFFRRGNADPVTWVYDNKKPDTNTKGKSDSPDATIKVTSHIQRNDQGKEKDKKTGETQTVYGTSGYSDIEYTEGDIKISYTVDVWWFEAGADAGQDKFEFPAKSWKGTISYNPNSKNGLFHLKAANHPEAEIFFHPAFWSEGCPVMGKGKNHQGEILYLKMVDMVKNGKRIDYELKVSDERTDPEKEKRPLP